MMLMFYFIMLFASSVTLVHLSVFIKVDSGPFLLLCLLHF